MNKIVNIINYLNILLAATLASMPFLGSGCAPVGVVIASYVADGALLVGTNKSGSDHIVSMASKRDCAAWRTIKGQAVCKDRGEAHDPYDVDYDAPFRAASESGVETTLPPSAGGGLLAGDAAEAAMAGHVSARRPDTPPARPAMGAPPPNSSDVAAGVPPGARGLAAAQPAVAPSPEGAERVAAAGTLSRGQTRTDTPPGSGVRR